MIIVLLIAVGIVSAFISYLGTPKGKGWLGELKVKLIIKRTKPGVRYVINNLVLRLDNGKTAQIDHVLINHSGIFVIETKNYSGRIYGDDNRLEWTQVLNYGKIKNKIYNPVRQNKSHIYHISKILSEDLEITSAVVLVQGNIQHIESDDVYSLYWLKRLINKPTRRLTLMQMKTAYCELLEANDTTVTQKEHIQNIHDIQDEIRSNICPRCGKDLVVRHGKNGDFMGCSGYPDCRFTKNL